MKTVDLYILHDMANAMAFGLKLIFVWTTKIQFKTLKPRNSRFPNQDITCRKLNSFNSKEIKNIYHLEDWKKYIATTPSPPQLHTSLTPAENYCRIFIKCERQVYIKLHLAEATRICQRILFPANLNPKWVFIGYKWQLGSP